jgi:rod shape-determining protein MreC
MGFAPGCPSSPISGLVGRISEVTENSVEGAAAQRRRQLRQRAAGRKPAQRHRDAAAPGGDLIMDFIPQGPTFEVGEGVLSSGLGGQFPRGMAIGVIESIDSQPNAVFQTARVRPAVDFGSLELVMVITNFEPNEVAA